MPSSLQDNEKFKQGLLEDLAQAETMAKSGAESRGSGMADPTFNPRAVRIVNKTVGEKEIKAANAAIGRAIDGLIHESGMVDQMEQGKFRSEMEKRFNKYKMFMIQKAHELDKQIAKQGLDRAKRDSMFSLLGQSAGMLTEQFVKGAGKKGG